MHGYRKLGTDKEKTRDREQGALTPHVFHSHPVGDYIPYLSRLGRDTFQRSKKYSQGVSVSATAAASGEADSRCSFFEGGEALVAARARLTIVVVTVKKRDVMHVIARSMV